VYCVFSAHSGLESVSIPSCVYRHARECAYDMSEEYVSCMCQVILNFHDKLPVLSNYKIKSDNC
jgi:hypothetical protein